jgi:hypothetical protein
VDEADETIADLRPDEEDEWQVGPIDAEMMFIQSTPASTTFQLTGLTNLDVFERPVSGLESRNGHDIATGKKARHS